MPHMRRRARLVRAVVALGGAIVLILALAADSQPARGQDQPLAITLDPSEGPDDTTATVRVTGIADDEIIEIHFWDTGRRIHSATHAGGTYTTSHTFHRCRGDQTEVFVFAASQRGVREASAVFTITDPPCDGESLRVGANSVVYRGLGLPVEDALGGDLFVGRIWRFDNGPPGRWLAWDPDLPSALQGFTFLNPNSPYIVMADRAVDWRFRTTIPPNEEGTVALKVTFDPVAGPDLTDVTITIENAEPGETVALTLPGGTLIGPADANGRFVHQDTMRGCRGDTISAIAISGATGFERRGASVFTITDPPCTTVDLVAGINSVAYTGLAAPVDEALGDLLDCCEVSLWQLTDTWLLWSSRLPTGLQGFQELMPNTHYFVDIDRPGQWNMPVAVGGPGGIFAEGPEGITVLPSEGPSGTTVDIEVWFNPRMSGLTPLGGAPITVRIGSDVREIGVAVSPELGGELIIYSTSFTVLGCRGPVPIEAEIAIPGRAPVILTSSFTITDPPCPGEEEPAQPSTVHIASIDTGGVHRPGVSSDPVFCLTVANDLGNLVEGATVSGRISGQTVSGVTDADGRVDLRITVFVFGSYRFDLTAISHPDLAYDASADVATSATVELQSGQANTFGCAVM